MLRHSWTCLPVEAAPCDLLLPASRTSMTEYDQELCDGGHIHAPKRTAPQWPGFHQREIRATANAGSLPGMIFTMSNSEEPEGLQANASPPCTGAGARELGACRRHAAPFGATTGWSPGRRWC